ncbi:hypothetical protein D3C77_294210 [compost metagenome]
MAYFVMEQDKRYGDVPRLQHIQRYIELRHLPHLLSHHVPDTLPLQVSTTRDSVYTDVLSEGLYIVSAELQKIIAMYEPYHIWKSIPLMDRENQKQTVYYLPIFPEVEVLSSVSQFNLDRSRITKLVLDADKVKGRKVFRVKESEVPLVIVSLDVAESIMRRDFIGVSLTPVQVEGWDDSE